MDPALTRLDILLAVCAIALVTVIVEWLCKSLWMPIYFQSGIRVFHRRIRLAHARAFTAESLEREYRDLPHGQKQPNHNASFTARIRDQGYRLEPPRMLFRRIDERHIAFRTGWYASSDRALIHTLLGGTMHGLLSRSAGEVIVDGYLSWAMLAHFLLGTTVLVTVLRSGDARAILPFLALIVVWLFALWLCYGWEFRRYERVAQLVAQ